MFNSQERSALEQQAVWLFCQHMAYPWQGFTKPQGYGVLDGDFLT